MTFQSPVTIEKVLAGIHTGEYLLPAIQREFVWNTRQICQLFDSVMRGYPIGSFLLWQVSPATASSYTFYNFLTDFHERDRPYAAKATVPAGQGVTAILDGQQRLTALNIAIYGSHAEKKKYAWWSSPDAFPKKRLYLDLLGRADPDELGLAYTLRFLTQAEAKAAPGEPQRWFRVGDILKLPDSGPGMMSALRERHIDLNEQRPFDVLYALFNAIRVLSPINYYLETSQEPDRVLDIFVRVNSGGTVLSYSDLLLSMATNQWRNLDAREEVRNLVAELNTGGSREFNFSKDVVLKTALMIAGVDLRFRVSNFTEANMRKVEQAWPQISAALIRAADVLNGFGFSARTLTADSVVIPIAYYLAQRKLDDSYLAADRHAPDRATLRTWVIRSLVKRGIWGSGLDTTLGRIRSALDTSTGGFPLEPIETEMASIGKSLKIDPTELDELLNLRYNAPRTFAVLSMLYPGLDLTHPFHEDHIFPRSRFTRKRLTEQGIAPADLDTYLDLVDQLPNLQLLAGTRNIEKQAKLPAQWLDAFPDEAQRNTYVTENDLEDVPLELTGFPTFMAARRQRMRARLATVLGV